MNIDTPSGEIEAIVLVKAAPQVGQKHGETVCCAALDINKNWLRLYPITFRKLNDAQKFNRWDHLRFKCCHAPDDPRSESRRVEQRSLEIIGKLEKMPEKQNFLASSIVTSVDKEQEQGRSLALLKAEILDFIPEKRTKDEIRREKAKFDDLRNQLEMFDASSVVPYTPCPYRFKYHYKSDDGKRTGTCQDWEIEAAYYNWSIEYGPKEALDKICKVFGEEHPRKGMLLAMGTHSLYPNKWLINGAVRLDEIKQRQLF